MANETLYKPSAWSKRFPTAKEVLDNHVKVVTALSEEARKNFSCELDLTYGDCGNDKFDYFGTDLPDEAPIFIYIHGGYWQNMDYKISSFMVKPLYANGIKVIILGYTLCPKITLLQLVDNIKKGLDKALEKAKYKSSRKIIISGHSAGAHLTMSLFGNYASENPKPSLEKISEVVLISGVFNLIPLVSTTVNDPLKLDEETAKSLSPIYKEIPQKFQHIKFRIVVGQNESPGFFEQSQNFNEKLLKGNFHSTFETIKGVDHFDIVESLNDEDFVLMKKIIQSFS